MASNCAASATASGKALLATAEKSVGNRIERIMIQYRSNWPDKSHQKLVFGADAHLMERAPDEKDRDQKENRSQNISECGALLLRNADRQLHRQQTKKR